MTTIRNMTSTLLLVEPSETMRYVLQNHLQSLGFDVQALADYAEADEALATQFAQYDKDIAAVLLGWPTLNDAAASTLLARLESAELPGLPVIVLSTDMRADTRAWVAGREHTAVLPWREYQQVATMLERLLDQPEHDGDVFERKFDNSDIHLLIVDDSASIRYTLADLFRLQGYRVSVAADPDAALGIARDEPVDIAILDFYLQDTTGDQLCKRLQQGGLAARPLCTVLTGSYSDHIIKRSLRAGAIECMFKNESSELLLARIDAIGRLVRQRRQLAADSRRLTKVIDSLDDVVALTDDNDRVLHPGPAARSRVVSEPVASLAGRRLQDEIDTRGMHRDALDGVGALWRIASGESASAAGTPGSAFEMQLRDYLGSDTESGTQVSLLLIAVFARDVDANPTERRPSDAFDGVNDALLDALRRFYRREHHTAYLGGNRFAVLLRHSTPQQSYALTRKLMQLISQVPLDPPKTLNTTGCLLALGAVPPAQYRSLLDRAAQGLDIVTRRGMDQALLLDVRKVLPVGA